MRCGDELLSNHFPSRHQLIWLIPGPSVANLQVLIIRLITSISQYMDTDWINEVNKLGDWYAISQMLHKGIFKESALHLTA